MLTVFMFKVYDAQGAALNSTGAGEMIAMPLFCATGDFVMIIMVTAVDTYMALTPLVRRIPQHMYVVMPGR